MAGQTIDEDCNRVDCRPDPFTAKLLENEPGTSFYQNGLQIIWVKKNTLPYPDRNSGERGEKFM